MAAHELTDNFASLLQQDETIQGFSEEDESDETGESTRYLSEGVEIFEGEEEDDDALDESSKEDDIEEIKSLLEDKDEDDTEKKDETPFVGNLTEEEFGNLNAVFNKMTGGKITGEEVVNVVQWVRQQQLQEQIRAFDSVLIELGTPKERLDEVRKDITAYWSKLPKAKQILFDNTEGTKLIFKFLNQQKGYTVPSAKQKKDAKPRNVAGKGEVQASTAAIKTQAEAIAKLSPEEYKKLGESGALNNLPLF